MSVRLRPATQSDIPMLTRWDLKPHVIRATTDDLMATNAFEGIVWAEELESAYSQYLIAELSDRPIGAMQIIDPHLEPTHYWGDIEPNLRALDIWIGEEDCLGKGYGETMMRLALEMCFADRTIEAIVIDPLASNTRAHRFYRRLGFREIGPRRFGDGGEDLCLVHRLERAGWAARKGQA